MTPTLFFRHLSDDNKGHALLEAVTSMETGEASLDVYAVNPDSFAQVPGSPFAYWVSERIRRLFVELPAFDGGGRTAKRGPSSGDDFRRVRLWTEVGANSVGRFVRWVPFSKGGEYSRYYSDVHLVVAWDESRRTFLDFVGRPGRMTVRPESLEYFFRPGLTWPRSTVKGFNVRVLPCNAIFADKGPSAFVAHNSQQGLLCLLGLMSSSLFEALIRLQGGSRAWEVGTVQQTPVPITDGSTSTQLASAALLCWEAKRAVDLANEVSHVFLSPSLITNDICSLDATYSQWKKFLVGTQDKISKSQTEIDSIAYRVYDIPVESRTSLEEGPLISDSSETYDISDDDVVSFDQNSNALVDSLISYVIGSVYGRWDVRVAMDRALAPALQGPFDSLPVCPPGMLVGTDGLPATPRGIVSEEWLRARPNAITLPDEGIVSRPTIFDSEYPLRLEWDGIMVDDEGHPDDVVARIRDVFNLIWHVRAGEIEREACEYLGVDELRDYMRNPRNFWDAHVKRYSKSRRKAPIYWLLQSNKRNFGVWLYYHRMDADILYKVLRNYVDPKINRESNRLEELRLALPSAIGAGGRTASQAQEAVEDQEALIAEVEEFRQTLERVALLGLTVDHDDGVLLSIAPLHELVPWKPARQTWDELVAGKYEWSTMSKQMREKGLVRERGSRR